MGTAMDNAGVPSSLTQRRQAASNLPAFELPPPSQFTAPQFAHKFPPLSGLHSQSMPPAVSVGNLLTPPPNSGSDSGTSSGNINAHGMPVLPYTPNFWPGAGNTPNGFTGLTPQPWQNGQLFPGRHMFSPVSGSISRNDPISPASGGGAALPPPPYDISSVQPFPQGVQLTSSGQQLAQNQQHPGLSSQMQNGHVLPRTHSQTSPISPLDAVSKATSGPGLFAAMTSVATPQPPFGFQSSTPVTQSPHSANQSATTSPPIPQGSIPQLHSPFIKPPYPSYSLPAMPGPVLTNINNPGCQMQQVGNMNNHMLPHYVNSGYLANPQLHYQQQRAHSPQQAQNQDRPFKCDECPQSFNRNHDLKRHKRIHLAVKPFPCAHCDKSFSRKDALKRHILVKGCGKAGESDSNVTDGVKSDSGSETQGDNSMSLRE